MAESRNNAHADIVSRPPLARRRRCYADSERLGCVDENSGHPLFTALKGVPGQAFRGLWEVVFNFARL